MISLKISKLQHMYSRRPSRKCFQVHTINTHKTKRKWVYSPRPVVKYASAPDNLMTHPYQTKNLFCFPHLASSRLPPKSTSTTSRRRPPKPCTYKKHNDSTLQIPSWNYASSLDTIVIHPCIDLVYVIKERDWTILSAVSLVIITRNNIYKHILCQVISVPFPSSVLLFNSVSFINHK